MAWTQPDLDALEQAIASGELYVQYGDRRVGYQTASEMLQVRAAMKAELAAAAAPPSTGGWSRSRRLARFSSGLASSDSGS